MSWLLNLGWALWAVSAAAYFIERDRCASRRLAEHERVQALTPGELRDADFQVLLGGRGTKAHATEAEYEGRHAFVVAGGLVILVVAQILASFYS